ncbi:MAG TPA: hypothetical protein VEP90_11465, partial [Methylomirabilota bacterium]|nr:hypothetical protein [Methylomirabilota bacterium]
AAYDFYDKFLYNEEKQKVYIRRGFPLAKMISSTDWEAMGSELVNENKSGLHGVDLITTEVKSAVYGEGFKFDMHCHSAEEKIKNASKVKYLFFSYSLDCRDVEVRIGEGELFKDYFDKWLLQYMKYKEIYPTKRFQRSIGFNVVKKRCNMVMEIKNRQLVFPINIDLQSQRNMLWIQLDHSPATPQNSTLLQEHS